MSSLTPQQIADMARLKALNTSAENKSTELKSNLTTAKQNAKTKSNALDSANDDYETKNKEYNKNLEKESAYQTKYYDAQDKAYQKQDEINNLEAKKVEIKSQIQDKEGQIYDTGAALSDAKNKVASLQEKKNLADTAATQAETAFENTMKDEKTREAFTKYSDSDATYNKTKEINDANKKWEETALTEQKEAGENLEKAKGEYEEAEKQLDSAKKADEEAGKELDSALEKQKEVDDRIANQQNEALNKSLDQATTEAEKRNAEFKKWDKPLPVMAKVKVDFETKAMVTKEDFQKMIWNEPQDDPAVIDLTGNDAFSKAVSAAIDLTVTGTKKSNFTNLS